MQKAETFTIHTLFFALYVLLSPTFRFAGLLGPQQTGKQLFLRAISIIKTKIKNTTHSKIE